MISPSVLIYLIEGSENSGEHGLGINDWPSRFPDTSKYLLTTSNGKEARSTVAIHPGASDVPKIVCGNEGDTWM